MRLTLIRISLNFIPYFKESPINAITFKKVMENAVYIGLLFYVTTIGCRCL